MYKKQEEIIDSISEIRENNNKNWMGLLKIAILSSPDETRDLLNKINDNDKKISKLLKELAK